MSRKPIDKQQPTECRQAVWDWIRANEVKNGPVAGFTAQDIDVMLDHSSIRDYLGSLASAGYLVATRGSKRGQPTLYTLVNNTGRTAPRVRKDGSEVTQGRSRQYMWNILKILGQFTARDLAYNASTPEHTVSEIDAKDYISHLAKANYLVPVGRPELGTWKLRHGMWTGPQPPQVQRTKQVYDPNLARVVWAQITGGAE